MRNTTPYPGIRTRAWLLAVAIVLACPAANAALDVLGVQYQQDKVHPEYFCIFDNRNYPNTCTTVNPGANVHVYLKNSGAAPVTVTDVTLAGYSLKTVVKWGALIGRDSEANDPYSIYYYWDNSQGQVPQAIFNAGEPVWYRYDPTNLPPGAVFQVVVRLRKVPTTQPVSLGIVTDDGLTTTANVTVDANCPQLASVGYSPDLTKVYLHWRRSNGAAPPIIKMDGTDVTAIATTVGDTGVNFAVSVLNLPTPLAYMSYHVFQGIYSDGKTATASLRAWTNRFNYGTYGAGPTTTWADARAWIDNCEDHAVNALIWNNGSQGLTSFLDKPEGQAYAADHGYQFIVGTEAGLPAWSNRNPLGWYMRDEPDAHDYHVGTSDTARFYPPQNRQHSVGLLAMHEIFEGDRRHYMQDGITPTVVNVDATFMPYNYYTYGQMCDIGMSDPYYNSRQAQAYWSSPKDIPLYQKATYIYAVAQALTESSEPNPTLIALGSTGDLVPATGWWPYFSPENVRMQTYYALAAGTKNMGYWWMLGGFGDGIITNEPACTALWNGIGLVGNEFKTAAPLIVISHPAAITLTPSTTNIWARALISGTDSMIVVVANDCYTNDINGFHYTPITNATVTARLPAWLRSSPTAFQISAAGLGDVSTTFNGTDLQMNLGTVQVTRLIVVTTNATLRSTIQTRYETQVGPHVAKFAPDLFINDWPSITQSPTNQTVAPGGTASFSVSASGKAPLSYQWQKDGINLSDDGHYTGCTNATLTIVGAGEEDQASYHCVVYNGYGSTYSASATLTVIWCTPSVLLQNGDFEDWSNGTTVATNWFSYNAGPGTVVFSKDTATVRTAGGASQKCRNTSPGTGSLLGVRQTIDANVGDAFTFAGWVYPMSVFKYQNVALAVRWDGATINPDASASWVTNTLNPNQWDPLQLAGNATSNSVTLFLDSRKNVNNGDITAYWDDVVSYRAYVPPAPAVSLASATSLKVDVMPGCNTNNTSARYAITIGGGAYTLGTHWVQAYGSVGTGTAWQTDAAWAAKTVTGLATGTSYTFKVKAQYSSTYSQATSLGDGSVVRAPVELPTLQVQMNGTDMILIWPSTPSSQLQWAASLNPPVNWVLATNPVSIVGGQKGVVLTPTLSVGFYRLVLQ